MQVRGGKEVPFFCKENSKAFGKLEEIACIAIEVVVVNYTGVKRRWLLFINRAAIKVL